MPEKLPTPRRRYASQQNPRTVRGISPELNEFINEVMSQAKLSFSDIVRMSLEEYRRKVVAEGVISFKVDLPKKQKKSENS